MTIVRKFLTRKKRDDKNKKISIEENNNIPGPKRDLSSKF